MDNNTLDSQFNETIAYDRSAPIPLRPETPKALDYPYEALGETLGVAVKNMHEVVMAPIATCAHYLLAATSLAVQGHADVYIPFADKTVPISLYLATIAASGERKSSVDSKALRWTPKIRQWKEL